MSLRTPKADADLATLDAFRESWFNYENPIRNRILEVCARNMLYEVGQQWISLDSRLIGPSGAGYSFKSLAPTCPQPVTNFIAEALEAELGSFAARKLTPLVIPTSSDPRIKAAAKASEALLQYKLDKMQWGIIRNEFDHHRCIFSLAVMWLRWDESYFDSVLTASEEAVECPTCKTRLSSPVVPEELLQGSEARHRDRALQGPEGTSLMACPMCEEPTPLQPFGEMTSEQSTEEDFFKRPLGKRMPKGEPVIEVPTRFDYFPENSGVGLTPRTLRQHGIVMVRPVDWIEERYPEIDKVEPEDPRELLRWHPAVNSWDIYGNLMQSGAEVYSNHCRVYTHITKPCMDHPKGLVLEWVGDKFARKYDLIREVGEGEAATHVVSVARFKDIPTRLDGKSMVDDGISLQNRINTMDSQFVEARLRHKAGVITPSNVSLDQPEWASRSGLLVLRSDPSPLAPNATPTTFSTELFPVEAYQERTACVQDFRSIVGPKGVETGEPPKNVSTTSGLQLLGEQIDKRRGPREEERMLAFTAIWEGTLQQLSVFRTELDQDSYEVLDSTGVWTTKQFDATTLMNQTKVRIEAQAEVSKSLIQREAVREAQADQLIDVSSPIARRKVLELRGLPTSVNDETNFQIDCADRQWVGFKDSQIGPVIDYGLDDPAIRFQVLRDRLLSEDGQLLQEQACWDKVLPYIAGWEQELQALEQADMATRAMYPDSAPDGSAKQFAQLAEIYVQQKAAYTQALGADKLAQGQGAPPDQLPPPPVEPPPPIFAPRDLSQRILMVWTKMLGDAKTRGAQLTRGGQDYSQTEQQAQDGFLQFMSVVYAYKQLAQAVMAPPPGAAPAAPPPTQGA